MRRSVPAGATPAGQHGENDDADDTGRDPGEPARHALTGAAQRPGTSERPGPPERTGASKRPVRDAVRGASAARDDGAEPGDAGVGDG
jgi:hypothetical protein